MKPNFPSENRQFSLIQSFNIDMEKLVSSWSDVQSVPQAYVLPPEKRPGNINNPLCNNIPVIDLGSHDRMDTIRQISKASEEFGFFQVINHGVPNKLIGETMRVFEEFHAMPQKDKEIESSRDPNKICKLYLSSENYANEAVHFWREALTHPALTSQNYTQFWPRKPTQYQEIVKAYTEEVRNLSSVILELLALGLGLGKDFFQGGLSEYPMLSSNHYPVCPDPSLTLGLPKHRDPTMITIIYLDKEGLQVFKDGNWIGVEPIPNAFVVTIGCVLQMISNSRFAGGEHRVVTNSRVARTTIAYFLYPSNESIIEPAKALSNPPLYRSMKFKDFIKIFKAKATDGEALSKVISLASS